MESDSPYSPIFRKMAKGNILKNMDEFVYVPAEE